MLTGRRSLERVIGKRRRFLPNRDAILVEGNEKRFLDESGADVVSCPVCQTQLPGSDGRLINSHLDECLARGRKRKLRQLTLLQFSLPKSKVQAEDPELDASNVTRTQSICISSSSNSCDLNFSGVSNQCETIHSSTSGEDQPVSISLRKFIEGIETRLLEQQPGSKIDALIGVEEFLKDYDVSSIFIPTFIVGRRYSGREDLDFGAGICLRRDPENPMDQNAIKVHRSTHESDNMLGYLPRDLTQYLSPLIDKFHLIFEGHIVSMPTDAVGAIPIQITCKKFELCDPFVSDIQEFMSLWKNVLCYTELSKMTKYQNNLRVLIQEVLTSNSYLLSVSEISFLQAFDSLSDDGQKLFARLYARKGPLFRMSKIWYPEISNCFHAANELLEVGYLRSLQLRNDAEMEQVLGTLTLCELQEALSFLRQKCNRRTRKQELIDLLLSSSKDGHGTELQSVLLSLTGSCVEVSPLAEALIWRAERLFFLNGEQHLSAFMLIDLGIMKYPIYRCINSIPVFSTRGDLISYEEAVEVSQIMVESVDENNFELVLRCIDISVSRMLVLSGEGSLSSPGPASAFLFQFSASWVYSKVLSLGVSFLERQKRYAEAINLLNQLLRIFSSDRRRGHWALRLSVDLEHIGHVDDSLCVAENSLSDPWVRAGSKIALQWRVLRLGKPPRRWKLPSFSKSVTKNISEVHVQGRPSIA